MTVIAEAQAVERARYGPNADQWAKAIGARLLLEFADAKSRERIFSAHWRKFELETGLKVFPPEVTVKKPPASERTLPSDPLIDAEEGALLLCIPVSTIKRMAHRGEIPSVPFPIGTTGKFRHRFRRSDLEAYLARLSLSGTDD